MALTNKSSEPGQAMQACNPSYWETEAEGFKIQGLPELQSDLSTSLGNLVRSYLKKWDKKGKKKKSKNKGLLVQTVNLYLSNRMFCLVGFWVRPWERKKGRSTKAWSWRCFRSRWLWSCYACSSTVRAPTQRCLLNSFSYRICFKWAKGFIH